MLLIVNEAEQAVVSRFGVITKIIVDEHSDFHERYKDALKDEITMSGSVKIEKGSGVHVKMPFVDKVDIYPSLMFSYASAGETVNTLEKKQYHVSTYAQWTIADPALFSLKLGTSLNAENQLDNLIHPVIVQAINRLSGDDFISNKAALNAALKRGLDLINGHGIRGEIGFSHPTKRQREPSYDRESRRAKCRSCAQGEHRTNAVSTPLLAAIDRCIDRGQSARGGARRWHCRILQTDPQFYALCVLQAWSSDETTCANQDHPIWKQLLTWGFQQ